MKLIKMLLCLSLGFILVACGGSSEESEKGTKYFVESVIANGTTYDVPNTEGTLIFDDETFKSGDISNGNLVLKCEDGDIELKGELKDCRIESSSEIQDVHGIPRTVYTYKWTFVDEASSEEYEVNAMVVDVKEDDGDYNKVMLIFEGSQKCVALYISDNKIE